VPQHALSDTGEPSGTEQVKHQVPSLSINKKKGPNRKVIIRRGVFQQTAMGYRTMHRRFNKALTMKTTRRHVLAALSGLGLSPLFAAMTKDQAALLQRAIPSTGEMLPAVGVGTWQTFDVGGSDAERQPLRNVLKTMIASGAKVIDSSPMYGNSEGVVGDLSSDLKLNDKLFIATKVWTSGEEAGIRQMNQSYALLKRTKMDLMQVHNLVDWQTHVNTLRKWKEEGKVRYIGITHYIDSAHDTLATIIRENPIDFVQVNYNLLDTHADQRLFAVAQERKVAVIINRPFQEGQLFNHVKGKTLPAWAADIDCKSWAQFFLKFIISHPAVTCAIPGTSKVSHLLDNLGAAQGRLPDEAMRRRMVEVMS
jgi:diketogulonate reductase-like aldo/keto reductase